MDFGLGICMERRVDYKRTDPYSWLAYQSSLVGVIANEQARPELRRGDSLPVPMKYVLYLKLFYEPCIHSSPPSQTSFFQIGMLCLSFSIMYLEAW